MRIKADDVWGHPSKNVLLLLMYILMRRRNATDWGTGKRPGLHEIEPRGLHTHHIFPFDYMSKHKALLDSYLKDGLNPADFRADINDITNLTFISQSKNCEIADTPPSQYLLNETTPEMRKAHFIPEDQELWKTENFRRFLKERQRLLGTAMTRFLKGL